MSAAPRTGSAVRGRCCRGQASRRSRPIRATHHAPLPIARLDPSLFQTQIEQARANLLRAQADLDRLRVTLNDAQTKLKRAQELYNQKLVSQVDLEAAQVAVQSADAQLKSQQAAVTQAQASLQQNQVNLEHTIITAPIDGLVISRNVDVGQTVAASMSAPTLFILAADLTKMQVIASLDESDVGRIRPGQVVHFRVDAYPAEDFVGAVSQVRLQPQTVQNVVTYNTVIDVPNPELKLKPGMTANVNIEIARRNNALRVPNAALRFRPTAEIFQALGQTPPAGGTGGGGRGGRGGRGGGTNGVPAPSGTDSRMGQSPQSPGVAANTNAAAAAAPATAQAANQDVGQQRRTRRNNSEAGANGAQPTDQSASNTGGSRGRGAGAGGQGRGNFQERMANMTPEERKAFMDRMRERGTDPEAMTSRQGGQGGGRGRQDQSAPRMSPQAKNPSATTIDALFAPLPSPETFGQVWLFQDGKLVRMALRLGVADGQNTELIQGDLKEDQDVVTNVITAAQRKATNAAGTAAPIFGNQRGGGFGGGGFGGGGGGPRGGGGGRGGR